MGMGNPLLDISSTVGQEMLDKYGVKVDDAILAEEKHLPIYKDLVDNHAPLFIAGGATQNSMRVAQWMLTGAGISGSTTFLGCIGKDEFGEKLANCAKTDGVSTNYMIDETTATGTCAVLVKDAERSLIANLAAANNFKKEHLLTDESKAIYEKAKIYYIAGFFLTVSVESLVHIGDHAVEKNKIFCLNLSAPFIVDFFGDAVATALEYADYLFCNETEAAAYGKKHGLGDDLKEVALKIASSSKKNSQRERTVVFTQGSSGTIVVNKGEAVVYDVVPLAKDELVDTNGAGDSFVGGFLAQIAQGNSIEDAVKAGHFAARYIIQQNGCALNDKCEF